MFSFLNAGERVTVNVGLTVLYRISLVGLVFGAFLLGMIAMFLFGLRQDRRIRDVLRAQGHRIAQSRAHIDHPPDHPPD